MKVLNIHTRKIDASKDKIWALFSTLSTKDDKVWTIENWPKMRLNQDLKNDSEGGHGPIRYKIISVNSSAVRFEFQRPKGFKGTHKFEIAETNSSKTEIKHTIEMQTSGMGTLQWTLAIRWLHDALIEDAFDKIENQFSTNKTTINWSLWVKFLRKALAPKRKNRN